ncbi:MAG TPA: glycosyltransferase family 39 protein, partial [Pyrinomonadaceae bacterium]
MNALLAILSLLVGVSISLTVRGGASAVAVCACTAVVTWFLINTKGPHRVFLLRLFVGGLLVRVLVGTAIHVFSAQEFFGGDALTYDYQARLVLDFWGRVAPAGIADEMGANGVGRGMVYLVAVIYSLTGPNMLAVQFFNAVLGAATALLIFLCAEHIFGNARVARTAALLVAFYSSLVLWSSQALKDGPIVFLLAAAMLATLKLGERLRPSYLLVLVASMLATLSLRFYIFYMLAAAVAGSFVMGMRAFSAGGLARQFVVVLFAGLALTYMGVLHTAGTQ